MDNDRSPETQRASNKGHVTPEIFQRGLDSNISYTSYLFYLSERFIKIT